MKTFLLLSLCGTAAGLASMPPPTDPNNYFANPSATGGMAQLSIKDDPMAPLGKQWTSQMDRKVSHSSEGGDSPINFYGEENQANGKGGKGPLGKEWTSRMDMKVEKSGQPGGNTAVGAPRPHLQPYGLGHQANGQGGRSPLGKVRASLDGV